MKSKMPPRFYQALIKWFAPESVSESLVGDLQEAYIDRIQAGDDADRWYRYQVCRSLVPLFWAQLKKGLTYWAVLCSVLAYVVSRAFTELAILATADTAFFDYLAKDWFSKATLLTVIWTWFNLAGYYISGFLVGLTMYSARPQQRGLVMLLPYLSFYFVMMTWVAIFWPDYFSSYFSSWYNVVTTIAFYPLVLLGYHRGTQVRMKMISVS